MKKQQKSNDLLIPLLAVLVILPWIVHLAIYNCGYAGYDWYAADGRIADFYCYYKSYVLDIAAFFMAVVLCFRFFLYREKRKDMKVYLPLLCYAAFVVISTVCSVNRKASLQGNFESFESCFVLLSYLVLSVYAYQTLSGETDYKIIWRALLLLSAAFAIVGIFQMCGLDLMDVSWVRKLLMSEEEFALYGETIENTFSKGRVYLTLYNPNYAGIVLAMLFLLVFVMCMTENEKKKKTGYGILAAVLMILIWKTYARAAFLSAALVLGDFFFLQFRSKRMIFGRKTAAACFLAAALAAFAFLAFDYAADFKYLSRIMEKNDREPLEAVTTEADGIHIRYDGRNYLIWLKDDAVFCREEGKGATKAFAGEEMRLPMEPDARAVFMGGEEQDLAVYLADTTLHFVKRNNRYFYRTQGGKRTEMTNVEAVDFYGLEYLGSARGYIWSRTLPLLKKSLLAGTGPDTFAEVFPQNDYAGKIVYSDRPDMVIEKAHNDYLTKWVQTGMGSVVCIVIFYFLLFQKGKEAYKRKEALNDFQSRVGYGCYLACLLYMTANFFNDSTLQTSPVFWIFSGIAFQNIEEKQKKERDCLRLLYARHQK